MISVESSSFRLIVAIGLLSTWGCQHRTLIETVEGDGGVGGQGGQTEMFDGFVFEPVDARVPDAPVCVGPGCEGDGGDEQPFCGNSKVEDGEECDDGNPMAGDGCSGLCRKEANYDCPTPGQMCVSTIVCGDGVVMGGEDCDDKNTTAGDGCSATCVVEDGYACTKPGEACTPVQTSRCGDSMVNAGEGCDDGNTVSFDGCSGSCQREAGWSCPTPGAMCTKDEFCGDGILSANEECDDKNVNPGDGCTGTCKREPFFVCPVAGMPCQTTIVCGDRKVVADEACDDGNTTAGDGCSADCKISEPGFNCPKELGVGGECTPVPVEKCGDGRLSYGEFCDDGDAISGDGCSSTCREEPGYTCEAPGMRCKLLEWCGDGKLSLARGEQCDDTNTVSGDGCTADCVREANYVCPEPGKLCESTIRCGDGRIAGAEECDDGDVKVNDGCSATCKVESGWVCPAGSTCRAKECGDRIIAGAEQCDDGGKVAGDGCSAECKLELPKDTEPDGWVCPTPGMSCQRTNCGNGTREGSEQCDDGNNDSGDGCSPFCRREPLCPAAGGACTTACGDGLLLPIDIMAGQECDDGNTAAGDGCSATCKVEAGYTCTLKTVQPDPLILPITFRDFKAYNETNGHPDFEQYNGQETGIVQTLLGANGKPVHVAANMTKTTNNNPGVTFDYFGVWYKDDPTYNKTVKSTLTFTKLMTGEFQYANSSFFPLNGLGWGNYQSYNNGQHNFHFTSEVRYWFEYRGGERLDFSGDDDVWVFINKRLAVDIGGVHGVQNGSVILHASNGTGAVCDLITTNCSSRRTVELNLEIGKVYEIVVFQAERHVTQSNYRLTLSNFNATRSECTPVCGDGIVTPNEACDLGTAKNTGAYGTCNANCTLPPRCGDAVTSAPNGEQCDNGINQTPYGGTGQVCGAGCKWAPYCGDTMVDGAYGEECDQGANNGKGYGFCTTSCKWGPRCGDGVRSDGEECDDGAMKNGTSASKCMVSCKLKCGNGMPDPGEQCDEGTANNTGAYGKCRMDCTLGPRCGDGIPNGGEQCDDGKNDGSYGTCAPGCTFGPRCGDQVVQSTAGEICDQGANNKPTPYGQNQCTTRCRPAPFCGDKAVDGDQGEVCDDGKNDGSPGSCAADCKSAIPLPSCGDGTKQDNEQCDNGAANGTAGSTCDSRCRFRCGNGFKDAGEQCDDGTNNGAYGTCNANCTLAPYCGDGTTNGSEACDLGSANEANPYGANKCSRTCSVAPFCGDGRIQSAFGEECDGGVGCGTTCKIVPVL